MPTTRGFAVAYSLSGANTHTGNQNEVIKKKSVGVLVRTYTVEERGQQSP